MNSRTVTIHAMKSKKKRMEKKDPGYSPGKTPSPYRSIKDRDLNTDEQHRVVNTDKDVVQETNPEKSRPRK